MTDIFKYFAGSGFPITTMIMVMAVILIFVALMMYMPALARRIFPQFGYKRYSRYIPFQTVYSDDSLELTDGTLLRVYRVTGVQTSMQDGVTREKFLDLRAQLFNQIHDPNVVMRFFMTRDAVDENTDYDFDQPVLQKIYDKWQAQGLRIFSNNYYIVLSVSGANARDKLNQYCNYLESILAAYRPKLLRNGDRDNMARFFGRINGIWVVDDYAHHPTEIATTLKAARQTKPGRLICAFQPHRYSRTQLLQKEYGSCFQEADMLILTDVYSAGEDPIPGIDGELLVKEVVEQTGKKPVYIQDKKEIAGYLQSIAHPGDLIMTMGAGDIVKSGEELVKLLNK